MELLYVYKSPGTRFPNKYFLVDDATIMIEVTNSKGEIYHSFIDKEDFQKVLCCNWKIRKDSNTFYLCNSQHGFIHRIISNCPDELTVDHIDGDGLNNRKSNLRNVPMSVNSFNKRNSKMIYYDDHHKQYRVYWRENGRQKSKSFAIGVYGDKAKIKAEEFKEYVCQEIYKRPTVVGNGDYILPSDIFNAE